MAYEHKTTTRNIKESKCPICGKLFYATSQWAYKINLKNTVRNVCSYSCTQGKAYKQKHEQAWQDGYNKRWKK